MFQNSLEKQPLCHFHSLPCSQRYTACEWELAPRVLNAVERTTCDRPSVFLVKFHQRPYVVLIKRPREMYVRTSLNFNISYILNGFIWMLFPPNMQPILKAPRNRSLPIVSNSLDTFQRWQDLHDPKREIGNIDPVAGRDSETILGDMKQGFWVTKALETWV